MVTLNTQATLNGGSITITLYEDVDGDGIADNVEEVSVPDGSGSTTLSNIQNESNDHWMHVEAQPSGVTSETQLSQASIQGSTPVDFTADGVADSVGTATLVRVRSFTAGGSATGTGSAVIEGIKRSIVGVKDTLRNRIQIGTK